MSYISRTDILTVKSVETSLSPPVPTDINKILPTELIKHCITFTDPLNTLRVSKEWRIESFSSCKDIFLEYRKHPRLSRIAQSLTGQNLPATDAGYAPLIAQVRRIVLERARALQLIITDPSEKGLGPLLEQVEAIEDNQLLLCYERI